jgi:hypothetical protein
VTESPNSEKEGGILSGVTPKSAGAASAVFLENIRDVNWDDQAMSYIARPESYGSLQRMFFDAVFQVVAHETGHAPGQNSPEDDHAEGGLMDRDSSELQPFSAGSGRRIRSAQRWMQ